MSEYYNTNRRKTKRHSLNIEGKIFLKSENEEVNEVIQVVDISYEGIGIVFSDNRFLFDYLKANKDDSIQASVVFNYEGKEYSFQTKIYWLRLYQLGEHNFYAASGLLFKDISVEEEKILEIILDMELNYVYLG